MKVGEGGWCGSQVSPDRWIFRHRWACPSGALTGQLPEITSLCFFGRALDAEDMSRVAETETEECMSRGLARGGAFDSTRRPFGLGMRLRVLVTILFDRGWVQYIRLAKSIIQEAFRGTLAACRDRNGEYVASQALRCDDLAAGQERNAPRLSRRPIGSALNSAFSHSSG